MENKEFKFTYKAPSEEERKEIESIKRQYEAPKTEEGKLERLRRLNNLVVGVSTAVGLALGIIGLLIFGSGLAMVLEFNIIAWGIVVMIAGIPPIAFAYPVYKKVLEIYKKKYGEEILKLSEELLNN